MPKEITKTVWLFGEMLEAVKDKAGPIKSRAVEKARQWLSEASTSDDWYSVEYEWWQAALEQIGITDAELAFSGFWSQGDGASFKSGIDLTKLVAFLTKDIPATEESSEEDRSGRLVKEIGGKVTNPAYLRLLEDDVINRLDASVVRETTRYCHEHTCRVEVDFRDEGEWISSTPEKEGHWVTSEPELVALVNGFREDVEQLRLDICRGLYKALEKEYEYQTSDEYLTEMSEGNEYTFDVYGDRDG